MSERQLKRIIHKLKADDPRRDEFIQVVLPSLRKTETTKDNKLMWVCVYCKKSPKSHSQVSFTMYASYLRHLSEKHRSSLPCNGNIFESPKIKYECHSCNKTFSRKEHFMYHVKTKYHNDNKEKLTITFNKTKTIQGSIADDHETSNTKDELKAIFGSSQSLCSLSDQPMDCNDVKIDDEDTMLINWINENINYLDSL